MRKTNGRKSAIIFAAMSLTVLPGLGSNLRVQERDARKESPRQTVEKVIARNIRSRGGYRVLKRIKTLTKTGVYTEGNAVVDVREDDKRPNLKRASWKYKDQGGAEGYDGVNPPWEFDGRGAKINTGEAALATLRGAEFEDPFIDYSKKGHSVELIGKEKLSNRDVYHLKVTLKDGFIRHYYFDVKTSLVIGIRQSMPFHARGPSVESYTYYDDYRPVAGVLFPYHLVQKRASDGGVMFEIQWSRVEANRSLEATWFRKPTGENRLTTVF